MTSTDPTSALARQILRALEPATLFRSSIRASAGQLACGSEVFELDGPVALLGLGKAAVQQLAALREILLDAGTPLSRRKAIAVTTDGHPPVGDWCEVHVGSHPMCDERSVAAGEALLGFVEATDEPLVVCLSGGGSALACVPRPPFALEDKIAATETLLVDGATIGATNSIRREMSALKNGGLALASKSRALLTLITSDVPGDDLGVVASGPTIHQPLDRDMIRRLVKQHLSGELRERFECHLDSAERARWHDRADRTLRDRVRAHWCVGDHRLLADTAESIYRAAGYRSVVRMGPVDEPIDTGLQALLRQVEHLVSLPRPAVLLSTGEMPVVVRGDGRGGRCSEFVGRMADALFLGSPGIREQDLLELRVAALATDGRDGNTDAAGGWLDCTTSREHRGAIREALMRYDTGGVLNQLGRAFVGGPTGTNLMDLRIVEIGDPQRAE